MVTLDIIILVILAIGVLQGFVNGFVKQLASLLGLVVGLLAAKALYATLAVKLSPILGGSLTFAQGVSFFLVWVAVPMAFAWIASLLTKALEIVSLGCLNRVLGAVLGLLKYALFTSLLIGVIEYMDADHTWIDQNQKKTSELYYPMESFAEIFFPAAKTVWEEL